ncbi:MAG TPA: LemA family protein [Phycisphaerales bacterium]|nr:LemA family protein [Phycisphaerales bacterium]
MGGISSGLLVGLVVAGIFVVLVLIVMGMYNALVRKRIDTENAWSQIDVQLKRRYDLIPNLVETVKGYAGHERGTLEAVIQARNQAVSLAGGSASVAQRAEAEGMLGATLGRLLAISEAYPDLKANANFGKLQEELTSTENRIGFSRQHYNDTVARYEEARQSFPTALIAGAFNFQKKDYFNTTAAVEREAPKVSFT